MSSLTEERKEREQPKPLGGAAGRAQIGGLAGGGKGPRHRRCGGHGTRRRRVHRQQTGRTPCRVLSELRSYRAIHSEIKGSAVSLFQCCIMVFGCSLVNLESKNALLRALSLLTVPGMISLGHRDGRGSLHRQHEREHRHVSQCRLCRHHHNQDFSDPWDGSTHAGFAKTCLSFCQVFEGCTLHSP